MIENISQDSAGKIKLKIRHSNPSSGHYINLVEVDIDGNIQQFNLQPQTTDPFDVELELGALQGTPNVRARAHCIIHGYSAWSDQIAIPELPIPALALLGALVASLVFIKKER
jgi:desulfoferrodoxin (superoxide reductase-like protein)